MIKKIIQYTLLAAAIGAIVYVLYRFNTHDQAPVDSLSAVPSGASMVMEVHHFNRIGRYEEWLREMASGTSNVASMGYNPAADWPLWIARLDSLRSAQPAWQKLLMHSSVVFSGAGQAQGSGWLLSIGLPQGADGIDEYVKYLLSEFSNSSERTFKETEIITKGTYHMALVAGCLVIGSSPSVVEEAIIQAQKGTTLSSNQQFAISREVASHDVPLNFYFELGENQWLQLDPLFDRYERMMSGYALVAPEKAHPLQAVSSSGLGESVSSLLPANTSLLDVFSYNSFEEGWRSHESLNNGSTASLFWERAWKDFGDSCSCDLNERMLNWRSGQWGTAVLPLNDSTTASVGFYQVVDSADVPTLMATLLKPVAGYSDVFATKFPELFDRNASKTVLVEALYLTQVDDFVFVAQSPLHLQVISSRSTSLADFAPYRQAMQRLEKDAGRYIYQREYYVSPLPGPLLAFLQDNEYVAASIKHGKEQRYLFNIVLPPSTNLLEDETTQQNNHSAEGHWQYQHSAAIRDGWSVKNHNTQLRELLFQDADNALILLGTDGKVLWKKALSEAIIGSVEQIDALKNGKLQYLFTTPKALYLVDRNGHDVKGFPVALTSPVCTPVHVFDYDNQKNYRILFGTQDYMIHNYTASGAPAEGWKYTGNAMASYIGHCKVAGEDVLVVACKDGSVTLHKRTGVKRAESALKLGSFKANTCLLNTAPTLEECSMTYADQEGNLWSGSLISGNTRKLFESANNGTPITLGDMAMDGKPDYIFSEADQLYFDKDKSKSSQPVKGMTQIKSIEFIQPSSTEVFTMVTTTGGMVWAFQHDGKVVAGFPKRADRIIGCADVNGDRKSDFILLTGNQITAVH